MRKYWVFLLGLLILLAVNYSIYQREQLVTSGKVVLLELAPVDPRSLMQGDYMALRFAVANDAMAALEAQAAQKAVNNQASNGHLVLSVGKQGVGHFARLDDGSELGENEIKMVYRQRGWVIKFATNAFFFQEGKAALYEAAKYGEFRVNSRGQSILVLMRDEAFQVIGSPS